MAAMSINTKESNFFCIVVPFLIVKTENLDIGQCVLVVVKFKSVL